MVYIVLLSDRKARDYNTKSNNNNENNNHNDSFCISLGFIRDGGEGVTQRQVSWKGPVFGELDYILGVNLYGTR